VLWLREVLGGWIGGAVEALECASRSSDTLSGGLTWYAGKYGDCTGAERLLGIEDAALGDFTYVSAR
jgi:hypothetical protein